jgi:hypothetical protein
MVMDRFPLTRETHTVLAAEKFPRDFPQCRHQGVVHGHFSLAALG